MNNEEEIILYARSLFDVVGVASDPSTKDTILILGLVSTPERDLEDFVLHLVKDSTKSIMRGFIRWTEAQE